MMDLEWEKRNKRFTALDRKQSVVKYQLLRWFPRNYLPNGFLKENIKWPQNSTRFFILAFQVNRKKISSWVNWLPPDLVD